MCGVPPVEFDMGAVKVKRPDGYVCTYCEFPCAKVAALFKEEKNFRKWLDGVSEHTVMWNCM